MFTYKTIDEQFVQTNFKDPTIAAALIKGEKKRDKVITGVLISFILLACLAIVYAIIETNRAATLRFEAKQLSIKKEECIELAHRQMLAAREKAKIIENMHEAIQEQIATCQNKK